MYDHTENTDKGRLGRQGLYCIVLYCIVLYCTVLYCIVLHCIALHCIALHCIALHCVVLYCFDGVVIDDQCTVTFLRSIVLPRI